MSTSETMKAALAVIELLEQALTDPADRRVAAEMVLEEITRKSPMTDAERQRRRRSRARHDGGHDPCHDGGHAAPLDQGSGSLDLPLPPTQPGSGAKDPDTTRAQHGTRQRATFIDPAWQPSPSLLEAIRVDLGVRVAPSTVAGFVAYWTNRTDAKARKVDWNQTFRGWIARDVESGRIRPERSNVLPFATAHRGPVAALPEGPRYPVVTDPHAEDRARRRRQDGGE